MYKIILGGVVICFSVWKELFSSCTKLFFFAFVFWFMEFYYHELKHFTQLLFQGLLLSDSASSVTQDWILFPLDLFYRTILSC